GVGFLVHPASFVNFSNNNPRINCINSNAFGRQFQRCAARKLIHRRFGDAVCQYARECPESGDTGDVNDVPTTFDQARKGSLHQTKNCPDVDSHHFIPLVEGRAFNSATSDMTRGVYQHIDSATLFNCAFDGVVSLALNGQVRFDSQSSISACFDLFGDISEGLLVAPHASYSGTGISESNCTGSSDSRSGAGDEGDSARKLFFCHLLFSFTRSGFATASYIDRDILKSRIL